MLLTDVMMSEMNVQDWPRKLIGSARGLKPFSKNNLAAKIRKILGTDI